MIRRISIYLTLIGYGVVALAGQGLHALEHLHAEHDQIDQLSGSAELSSLADAGPAAGAVIGCQTDDDGDGCHHDAEHCAICQHHSLGQIFTALPPLAMAAELRGILSDVAPEAVICPVLVYACTAAGTADGLNDRLVSLGLDGSSCARFALKESIRLTRIFHVERVKSIEAALRRRWLVLAGGCQS